MFVEKDLAQKPNTSIRVARLFSALWEEALVRWVPDVLWSLSSSIERWPRNQEPCRHLWDKVVMMVGPRCPFACWRKGLLLTGSCRPVLLINAREPSVQ